MSVNPTNSVSNKALAHLAKAIRTITGDGREGSQIPTGTKTDAGKGPVALSQKSLQKQSIPISQLFANSSEAIAKSVETLKNERNFTTQGQVASSSEQAWVRAIKESKSKSGTGNGSDQGKSDDSLLGLFNQIIGFDNQDDGLDFLE